MGLLLQPHIVVASMRKRYVKLASCNHIKFNLASFLETVLTPPVSRM